MSLYIVEKYRLNIIIKVPFCLLNIQSPREIIKRIIINVKHDATSGTNKFFFPQDSVVQSSGLSSTLKEVKDAN